MAMPRYKYAIGNAPVRFPSLTSQNNTEVVEGLPATSGDASEGLQPSLRSGEAADLHSRPSRWSLFFGGSAEAVDKTSIKKTRSQQDLRGNSSNITAEDNAIQDMHRSSSTLATTNDRQRSKSMYAATNANPNTLMASNDPAKRQPQPRQFRSSLYDPRNEELGNQRSAKRVSWMMPSPISNSSRSSSRANSIRNGDIGGGMDGKQVDEQTSLLRKNEMSQREQNQKPLSASGSFRPSSLFWTTDVERNENKENDKKPTSPILKDYGATENVSTSSQTPDEEDPYGYRALAGPALLPTFHERQKSKQSANSRANSNILSNHVSCSSSRWLSLIGLSIIATGLFFFLVI